MSDASQNPEGSQNPFDPDYLPPGQTPPPPATPTPKSASPTPSLPDSAVSDLNAMMREHAEDAIEHANVNFGVDLDGTPESMGLLEAIGHAVHQILEGGEVLTDAEFDILCKIYGGYLGEVIRKALGGIWEYDLEASPGVALISLKLPQGRVFPPMKWARRIEKGIEEDLRVFFERVVGSGQPPEKGE